MVQTLAEVDTTPEKYEITRIRSRFSTFVKGFLEMLGNTLATVPMPVSG